MLTIVCLRDVLIDVFMSSKFYPALKKQHGVPPHALWTDSIKLELNFVCQLL